MYLKQVYASASIREHLRSGPLGSLVDGFCRWLLGRQAARRTVQDHVSRVVLLNREFNSEVEKPEDAQMARIAHKPRPAYVKVMKQSAGIMRGK